MVILQREQVLKMLVSIYVGGLLCIVFYKMLKIGPKRNKVGI
jgi:hypothetical protein